MRAKLVPAYLPPELLSSRPKRDRAYVLYDLLRRMPSRRNKLLNLVNLNSKSLNSFLKFAMRKGLCQVLETKPYLTYLATEKAMLFIEDFEKVNQLIGYADLHREI